MFSDPRAETPRPLHAEIFFSPKKKRRARIYVQKLDFTKEPRMTPTRDLAQTFLVAAQAIGDRMLAELVEKDPAFAEAVAAAVAHGERLAVQLALGEEPVIELTCANDYGKVRRVATIPLRNGTAQH